MKNKRMYVYPEVEIIFAYAEDVMGASKEQERDERETEPLPIK